MNNSTLIDKTVQENVDIKFRIGDEQYDTADPKSMARCLGYAGKEDSTIFRRC